MGRRFGDLGTLLPFVLAYIAVVKIPPLGVVLFLTGAQLALGWLILAALRRRWISL